MGESSRIYIGCRLERVKAVSCLCLPFAGRGTISRAFSPAFCFNVATSKTASSRVYRFDSSRGTCRRELSYGLCEGLSIFFLHICRSRSFGPPSHRYCSLRLHWGERWSHPTLSIYFMDTRFPRCHLHFEHIRPLSSCLTVWLDAFLSPRLAIVASSATPIPLLSPCYSHCVRCLPGTGQDASICICAGRMILLSIIHYLTLIRAQCRVEGLMQGVESAEPAWIERTF